MPNCPRIQNEYNGIADIMVQKQLQYCIVTDVQFAGEALATTIGQYGCGVGTVVNVELATVNGHVRSSDIVVVFLIHPTLALISNIKLLAEEANLPILFVHSEKGQLRSLSLESPAPVGHATWQTDSKGVLEAIKQLTKGNSWVCPTMMQAMGGERDSFSELSQREREILSCIVREYKSSEIATKMNISIHTVNSHRKRILEKTGASSLVGLVHYAVRNGWV